MLNDYQGQRLPEPTVVCPEDQVRTRWQQELAQGSVPSTPEWFQPYSSTYSFVPASYSPDAGRVPMRTVSPGNVHFAFSPASVPLGGRKLHEVFAPSAKVAMFDEVSRHGRKPDYHCYQDVSVPLLFWDASVRVMRTADASEGADPNHPNRRTPLTITYRPQPIIDDPQPRSGAVTETMIARYQWTRGGLRGVDFGGSMAP